MLPLIWPDNFTLGSAGVAKLVYAPGSKSGEVHSSCRFESDLRHQTSVECVPVKPSVVASLRFEKDPPSQTVGLTNAQQIGESFCFVLFDDIRTESFHIIEDAW